MTQAAALATVREQYRKAIEAEQSAAIRAQIAFHVWDDAVNTYRAARVELSRATAALINAEFTVA